MSSVCSLRRTRVIVSKSPAVVSPMRRATSRTGGLLFIVATVLLLFSQGPLQVKAAGAEAAQVGVENESPETVVSLDDYCLESEAIDALSDEVLAVATPASLQGAVAGAMMRGWFDLCKNIILKGRERKVDFTSVVYQTKSKINSHLKDMANAIRGQAVSTVAPAFEWAQNDDTVAINVKLAHKLDTPATLDCQTTDRMITFGEASGADPVDNTTSYTFRAECAKSAKNFLLRLKLWAGVTSEGSTWEYGSVGRVSVRLRKTEVGEKWPQLLDEKVKRPSNMHTWWKMQSAFDDEKKAAQEAAKKAKETAEEAAKKEKGVADAGGRQEKQRQ